MKFYVIVISTLLKSAASIEDEELQTKYMSMPQSDFIEHFNEKNLSWKIKQYTNTVINLDFEKTQALNHTVLRARNYLPVKYHNPSEVGPLPENFDSRERWPFCPSIGEINSQMNCQSCWAHGVANTASDRICIHTNKTVYLSEQDLECSHENRTICTGGSPEKGFRFWMKHGIVTRQCKPYQPLLINRTVCIKTCVHPFQRYKLDKNYAQEVYRLPNVDYQIRAEIFLNGPIEASMTVFEDFHNKDGIGYDSGIYIHTYGEILGLHSVRVIGYGVENGVYYWLAANSWSNMWGENGFFRIKRFQEEILFEYGMLSGIPELNT